jgi:hypothetical protein
MSGSTKYYVAQYGCAIFGIGETEEKAIQDARDNGLEFSGSEVNHISGSALCGDKKNYKLVTAEGNELTYGMIICMSEEQKNLYWKW